MAIHSMVFQHRAQINVIYCVDFCFLDINTPKLLLDKTLRSHQLVPENIGLDSHW